MNGEVPHDLYGMVLKEVERPMLSVIMEHTEQNQSQAAQILGINRNTLRKKLRNHGLNDNVAVPSEAAAVQWTDSGTAREYT